ncbi:SAM-dependent methyltransferase [Cellvibrio mixtus]|uniref:Chemotaxis protein methyltransferase n=1 Tax=Cellvibrio mixtus TaxID=39650 RepID=A0A266Q304_9GAMM|nr:CheR family methyltransferase [Cellvibrio mixtus]OZY84222.1 SAM-dependent methyltransferase [Cellvibrio mixtus]
MSFRSDISAFALHRIRDFVHRTAGIVIGPDKTALVTGRLWRRLAICGLPSYDAYVDFIARPEGAQERSIMLDLLTTNETYFFREPAHFDFLRNEIIPQHGNGTLRVWCAAASTGEEPYSLAMVLADCVGNRWDMLATDISSAVIAQARKGVYRAERLNHMPADYLKRFCRRGIGEYEGMLVVVPSLREQVNFDLHNLLNTRPDSEQFDVIFLRNVLIYFDNPTKQRVLANVLRALRPGGWLILGHCESLQGLQVPVDTLRPSIYRKPAMDRRAFTRIAS